MTPLAESDETVPALTRAMVVVWELLAIWNTLGKFEAVPVPMFVTCAENDSCCPTVPEEGVAVVAPAVRSGSAAVTVWVTLLEAVPPAPVQVLVAT